MILEKFSRSSFSLRGQNEAKESLQRAREKSYFLKWDPSAHLEKWTSCWSHFNLPVICFKHSTLLPVKRNLQEIYQIGSVHHSPFSSDPLGVGLPGPTAMSLCFSGNHRWPAVNLFKMALKRIALISLCMGRTFKMAAESFSWLVSICAQLYCPISFLEWISGTSLAGFNWQLPSFEKFCGGYSPLLWKLLTFFYSRNCRAERVNLLVVVLDLSQ